MTVNLTLARNALVIARDAANAEVTKAEDVLEAAIAAVEGARAILAAAQAEAAGIQLAIDALGQSEPVTDPWAGIRATQAEQELFLAYAQDAGNWSGMPLVGGNVGSDDPSDLEGLEAAGLVRVEEQDEVVNRKRQVTHWVIFTEAGNALAKSILGYAPSED